MLVVQSGLKCYWDSAEQLREKKKTLLVNKLSKGRSAKTGIQAPQHIVEFRNPITSITLQLNSSHCRTFTRRHTLRHKQSSTSSLGLNFLGFTDPLELLQLTPFFSSNHFLLLLLLTPLTNPISLSLPLQTSQASAAANTASLAACEAARASATAWAAAATSNASLETKFEPNLVEEEETGTWGWRGWWVLSAEMVGRVGEWVGDEHMLVMAIKSTEWERVSEGMEAY